MSIDNISNIPPVIIQHASTGELLMVGHMNSYAYLQTLQSKRVVLYNPKSQVIEMIGQECGHQLTIQEFRIDPTSHCILIKVLPSDPHCNRCNQSVFKPVLIRE